MSSKLDPFFAVLFDLLNQRGASYKAASLFLATADIKISPQAVRSWHIRRSKKLQARAEKLPPTFGQINLFEGNIKKGEIDISPRALFTERSSPSRQAVSIGGLDMQIKEEERRLLSATPFSQTGFLIPRKSQKEDI